MFRRQINSGVALLNKTQPGWYKNIDLTKFDIESCHNCVCGQVYHFVAQQKELEILRTDGYQEELDGYTYFEAYACPKNRDPADFGFMVSTDDEYKYGYHHAWGTLQAEWVEKIKELQETDNV